MAESHIDLPAELPQSAAGLFGYLGYDMVRHIENLPNINPDPIGVPDALFLRPSVVAVLDGAKGEVILVSPVWYSDDVSARAAYAKAAERIRDAMRDLERPVSEARDLGQADEVAPPQSNFTKDGYMQAVEKAKEYIRAGDIFQVVPAQRWTQDFPLPPFCTLSQFTPYQPIALYVLFQFRWVSGNRGQS